MANTTSKRVGAGGDGTASGGVAAAVPPVAPVAPILVVEAPSLAVAAVVEAALAAAAAAAAAAVGAALGCSKFTAERGLKSVARKSSSRPLRVVRLRTAPLPTNLKLVHA